MLAAPAGAAAPSMTDPVVTAFNPYLNPADGNFDSQGFDFVNLFKNNKFTKSVGGHKFVFAGSYGLCGGMVYAALDTFNAGNGTTTPTLAAANTQVAPTPDSGALFNYLYARQLDSLGGGTLPTLLEYSLAPQQTRDGVTGLDEMTFKTFTHEIVPAINAGNPIPLLLVETQKLTDVSDDHQVLATGYFRRGGANGQAVVEIYDPNFPGRIMYLNTAENNGLPSRVESSDPAGQDVVATFHGFFSTNETYSYHRPRWALSGPTGNLLQSPGGDWTQADWAASGGWSLDAPLGASTATATVDPPDWTTTGAFTLAQYLKLGTIRPVAVGLPPGQLGSSPLFPTTTVAASIGGANNLFAGGPGGGSSSATQRVSLANDATLIDDKDLVATLSGDLGGWLTGAGAVTVTASFLGGGGHALGSFSVGPVTAVQRGGLTTLTAQSARSGVPSGTRVILVTMSAPATGGSYNTGYADNLALTIAPRPTIKVPPPPVGL